METRQIRGGLLRRDMFFLHFTSFPALLCILHLTCLSHSRIFDKDTMAKVKILKNDKALPLYTTVHRPP